MLSAVSRPIRDSCAPVLDRCFRLVPCLADPARRSSLGLKAALVTLHLVFVGVIFLVDSELIEKTKHEPWYITFYLLLFVATLVQYFITSGSSPGYVLDAMRQANERNGLFQKISTTSKQPASSKSGNMVIIREGSQPARSFSGSNATSWTKLVLDLYPPGTSIRSLTCSYCNVEQPPRAKHCHDCDRCVLQFDHHCVWLGTCVGLGNHCRFWWYICEETALCLWTGVLYVAYLKANIALAWWKDVIMIMLLIILAISLIFLLLLLLFHSYLILTNQTTYELVRRRRIPYLRGIPERVYPFSDGVCRNLDKFCCVKASVYNLERLPTAQEIEENELCLEAMVVASFGFATIYGNTKRFHNACIQNRSQNHLREILFHCLEVLSRVKQGSAVVTGKVKPPTNPAISFANGECHFPQVVNVSKQCLDQEAAPPWAWHVALASILGLQIIVYRHGVDWEGG